MFRIRERDTQSRSWLYDPFGIVEGLGFVCTARICRDTIILPSRRGVIFVHGCFWHGHEGCERAKLPETRSAFGAEKTQANKARDAQAIEFLEPDNVPSNRVSSKKP